MGLFVSIKPIIFPSSVIDTLKCSRFIHLNHLYGKKNKSASYIIITLVINDLP